MVAAPLDDSSSGWAWTAIKRRPAIVTPTLPGSAVRGPPHSMDVRAAVPPAVGCRRWRYPRGMSEPTSGTPTPGPQAPPEGRYGEPGRGSAFTSKSVAVVLTLLVGAFLAAGGYTIYQLNVTPSVTTEVV